MLRPRPLGAAFLFWCWNRTDGVKTALKGKTPFKNYPFKWHPRYAQTEWITP